MKTLALYDKIFTYNFYGCFVFLVMDSPQSIYFLKVGSLPDASYIHHNFELHTLCIVDS